MYWELISRHLKLKEEHEQLELLFSKLLSHRLKEFLMERDVIQKN